MALGIMVQKTIFFLEDVQLTTLGIWSRGYTDFDDGTKYKDNSLKMVEFLRFLQP